MQNTIIEVMKRFEEILKYINSIPDTDQKFIAFLTFKEMCKKGIE